MAYFVKVDDRKYKIGIVRQGNQFRATLNGQQYEVEVLQQKGGVMTLMIDNRSYRVVFESEEELTVNNSPYTVEIFDEQVQRFIKASPDKSHKKQVTLKAPMPGLVVDILVKQSDTVQAGQGLVVVEAMKMQNEMKTPRDGVVKQVFVEKGQTVNSGDVLIIIE